PVNPAVTNKKYFKHKALVINKDLNKVYHAAALVSTRRLFQQIETKNTARQRIRAAARQISCRAGLQAFFVLQPLLSGMNRSGNGKSRRAACCNADKQKQPPQGV